MTDAKVWWRVDESRSASVDEYDKVHVSHFLHVKSYTVLKETPTGVWLETGLGSKKFVRNVGKRCWARASRDEAINSFIARKEREIQIHQHVIKRSEAHIERAKLQLGKEGQSGEYVYI